MVVFPPRARLTLGERNFLLAAISVAAVGAGLACLITARLAAKDGAIVALDPFTLWTLVAGAVGALAGFFSAYHVWFGHAGPQGWVRCIIGGLVVSGVGSVIAGTLILPYYGTMFAPFQMIIAMIGSPWMALIWGGVIVAAHRWLIKWRAERDSIFFVEEPIL